MRNRTRTRLFPSVHQHDCPVYWSPGQVNLESSDLIQLGTLTEDSITDDISDPDDHISCKVCSSLSCEASVVPLTTLPLTVVDVDNGVDYPGYHLTVAAAILPQSKTITAGNVDWGEMVSSFADKVKGRLDDKAGALVFFAQLAKTVEMVRKPFSLFRTDWRKLASNLTARSLAASGSNLWLEGRYGWNLAYKDLKRFASVHAKLAPRIHNLLESESVGASLAITRTSSDNAPFAFLNSEYLHPPYTSPDYPIQCYQGGAGYFAIQTMGQVTECKIFGRRRNPLNRAFSHLDYLRQSLGVTGSDVLQAMWDLVPYSFVVDWFVNTKGLFALPAYEYLKAECLSGMGCFTKSVWAFQGFYAAGCVDPRYFVGWRFHNPVVPGSPGAITQFNRVAGLPNLDAIMFNKGISCVHAIDAVAMLLQRLL